MLVHGLSILHSLFVSSQLMEVTDCGCQGVWSDCPGDQSDGGAADTSADMGEQGIDLPGEWCQSANHCDCDGGGHPDSFHLILQEVFCFLSASNMWKVTQKYMSIPKIQMGHTKLLLPLDGFADWCHVFGKSCLWPSLKVGEVGCCSCVATFVCKVPLWLCYRRLTSFRSSRFHAVGIFLCI